MSAAVRNVVFISALLFADCATAPPYRLAPLPAEWTEARSSDHSVAFHHSDGGTIVADANCGEGDDVPLDVLTNHLLFGVENRKEQPRVPFQLDGRGALRTKLAGTMDGVQVAFDIVVLKKDGCIFDLYLISPPDRVTRREPEFDRFVAGFSKAKP